MDVSIDLIPSHNTEPYHSQIASMIQDHIDEFVIWEEYIDENGEIKEGFFNNYKDDDAYLITAEAKDTLVGFMVVQPDQHRPKYPAKDPLTLIALSMVAKPYRGNGIAKMLNKRMLEEEKTAGTKRICRSTWEANKTQVHIYKQFGFQLIGRWPEHREDGSDSLYFGRTLNNCDELVDRTIDEIIYEI